MTTLDFVVMHPRQQRWEVGVTRADGSRTIVVYTWLTKEFTDTPLDSWWLTVKAEAEVFDSGRMPL